MRKYICDNKDILFGTNKNCLAQDFLFLFEICKLHYYMLRC